MLYLLIWLPKKVMDVNGQKLIYTSLLCPRRHMRQSFFWFVANCKYSNTKPNVLQYFNSLSITKQTEYIIAKKNSKLDKHFRKWYFIGAPV